jgi:hypothetical protein
VLIVESNLRVADRLSAVLTRELITVVPGPKEAAEAIAKGGIRIGITSSTVFQREPILPALRFVPWIVLTDTIDDEIEVHRDAPEINAQFLVKDPQERYFELLPLRARSRSRAASGY